jgi:hypothetical protein
MTPLISWATWKILEGQLYELANTKVELPIALA